MSAALTFRGLNRRSDENYVAGIMARLNLMATGCMEWQGGCFNDGYAATSYRGKTVRASRLLFSLLNGPIPRGSVVCHSCDNRRCCNPEHLSLGSQRDNIQDMLSKGRGKGQLITHCPRGHEYSPSNTFVTKRGHRQCRECGRQRCRAATRGSTYRMQIEERS